MMVGKPCSSKTHSAQINPHSFKFDLLILSDQSHRHKWIDVFKSPTALRDSFKSEWERENHYFNLSYNHLKEIKNIWE